MVGPPALGRRTGGDAALPSCLEMAVGSVRGPAALGPRAFGTNVVADAGRRLEGGRSGREPRSRSVLRDAPPAVGRGRVEGRSRARGASFGRGAGRGRRAVPSLGRRPP